jgi:hypothetical protein
MAGTASLLIASVLPAADPRAVGALAMLLVMSLLGQTLILFAELFGSHASVDVARAARLITRGPWSGRFWGGVIVIGILAPLALVGGGFAPAVLGALFALLGLWIYEDLWVKAGQSIPLS